MRIYTLPKEMQRELDELTWKANELATEFQTKFVCRTGCSGCCETFPWNFIEVANLQGKAGFKKALNKLAKRVKAYNAEFDSRIRRRNIDLTDLDSFADGFKDMRCVFLYDRGCLVYEDRPLMCRLTASRKAAGCVGNRSLPPDYEVKASALLREVFYLSARFSKVHFPGKTVLGLPFRFLI